MTLYFTFIGLIMIMISAFIIYMAYNYIIDTRLSNKDQISYDTWIKTNTGRGPRFTAH
jgi:hypothetical protein